MNREEIKELAEHIYDLDAEVWSFGILTPVFILDTLLFFL